MPVLAMNAEQMRAYDQNIFTNNLPKEELERKLEYIESRWGITKEELIAICLNQEFARVAKIVPKMTRRKFVRYLKGLEQVFTALEKTGFVTDQMKKTKPHPFFTKQQAYLRAALTPEGYKNYLDGNWTHDVLKAVEKSHQEIVAPKRAKGHREIKPRVHFAPKSEFHQTHGRK